ncbi:hypothetical protein BJX62DRAFT_240951 [Aspergillus germanicus]
MVPDRHCQQNHLLSQANSQGPEFPAYNLAPSLVAVTGAEGYPIRTLWPNLGTEAIQQGALTPNATLDGHEFPMGDSNPSINLASLGDHPSDKNADYTHPASPRVELAVPGISRDDIASTEAIAKLSQVNLDLHIRLAAAEKYRTVLDLNVFLYLGGPLFIQDYTLADFVLKALVDFSMIITRLSTVTFNQARP